MNTFSNSGVTSIPSNLRNRPSRAVCDATYPFPPGARVWPRPVSIAGLLCLRWRIDTGPSHRADRIGVDAARANTSQRCVGTFPRGRWRRIIQSRIGPRANRPNNVIRRRARQHVAIDSRPGTGVPLRPGSLSAGAGRRPSTEAREGRGPHTWDCLKCE